MIILLYGSDTYRSWQKLKEIIDRYKKVHKSGLNLRYLNGKGLSFQDFKDEIGQTSMFREKKLTVLIDIFSNTEFKKKFLKETKNFLDKDRILVFYSKDKIATKDSLFTFLKKKAKCQEFNLLEGEKLKKWLKDEFQRLGAKVSSQVIEKLVEFVGNDLWQMENEIKKLVAFKKGKKIEAKDIELLVRPKIESDIFKTIDALASKDKKRTLKLLKEHLRKGDSPLYLFSMINFQFRNLLIIKDLMERNLSPFASSGLHPYVVKKSQFLSRRFDILELKKIYHKMARIDFEIKTGKIDAQTALDLLVADI